MTADDEHEDHKEELIELILSHTKEEEEPDFRVHDAVKEYVLEQLDQAREETEDKLLRDLKLEIEGKASLSVRPPPPLPCLACLHGPNPEPSAQELKELDERLLDEAQLLEEESEKRHMEVNQINMILKDLDEVRLPPRRRGLPALSNVRQSGLRHGPERPAAPRGEERAAAGGTGGEN